jgi:hypothetical protein
MEENFVRIQEVPDYNSDPENRKAENSFYDFPQSFQVYLCIEH